MFSLIRSLFPWGLLFLGGVSILSGATTLLRPIETEATTVSITWLEAGQMPEPRWLEVTDGVLYWPGAFQITEAWTHQETGQTAFTTSNDWYVPLVSAQRAGELLQSNQRSLRGCKVVVRVADADGKKMFSKGLRAMMLTPFTAKGRTTIATRLESSLVEHLEENVSTLDLTSTLVLDHGDRPMQAGEAQVSLVIGLVFATPGFLWIRWRRKRKRLAAAQVLPADVSPTFERPPPVEFDSPIAAPDPERELVGAGERRG